MFGPRRSWQLALLCGVALLLARPVRAVEINSGSNTTDPGTFPWNNVGALAGASAIYLGDIGGNGTYWVLTAYHVAGALPSSASFNGTGDATLETYNTVAGSYVRLVDPVTLAATDLVMFRLDLTSNPTNLSTLTLASLLPSTSATLYLAGYGGGTKQWGTNNGEGSFGDIDDYTINAGYGDVRAIMTDFDATPASEAQAIPGDSGGAVFDKVGSNYQLVGMIDAVSTDGTETYSADITKYRSQIMSTAVSAVPEPEVWMLGGLGLFVVLLAHRRRIRRFES